MDVHAGTHTTTSQIPRHRAAGSAKLSHFLRHLGEMIGFMVLGMLAAIPILALIFTLMPASIQPSSLADATGRFAVLICLVVAISMITPMVAWMRHRGHSWRLASEMAAAMAVPLLPIFALLGLGAIEGSSACGLYCAAMIPAMLVAMLFRLDVYTVHVMRAA